MYQGSSNFVKKNVFSGIDVSFVAAQLKIKVKVFGTFSGVDVSFVDCNTAQKLESKSLGEIAFGLKPVVDWAYYTSLKQNQ